MCLQFWRLQKETKSLVASVYSPAALTTQNSAIRTKGILVELNICDF
jgi:hypothetical protein